MDKEYIDREALLKDISESVVFTVRGDRPSLEICGANKVTDRIKSAPTADVVEVKHGEWKPKHYEGGFMDGTNFEECSICRYRRYFDDIRFKLTFDYCPKCGAKMDLKEGANNV